MATHYRGTELDNVNFFSKEAWICFQKALVDNTDCRPPNCYHIFFADATLASISVWGTNHNQAIDQIVYDYHKGSTFCHK